MVKTGALLGSFTSTASADFGTVSNGASYIKFHQGGTSKMVSREIMGFSPENLAKIKEITTAFVAAQIG